MFLLKIFGIITGIVLVFYGFYLAYAVEKKREVLGPIVSLAGLAIFLISILLLFVPRFFG